MDVPDYSIECCYTVPYINHKRHSNKLSWGGSQPLLPFPLSNLILLNIQTTRFEHSVQIAPLSIKQLYTPFVTGSSKLGVRMSTYSLHKNSTSRKCIRLTLYTLWAACGVYACKVEDLRLTYRTIRTLNAKCNFRTHAFPVLF